MPYNKTLAVGHNKLLNELPVGSFLLEDSLF